MSVSIRSMPMYRYKMTLLSTVLGSARLEGTGGLALIVQHMEQ